MRPQHVAAKPFVAVCILSGLPTEAVNRGFRRIREVAQVHSFLEFVESASHPKSLAGVLLPPHVETSQIVEEWEESEYLAERFGSGSHIEKVVTVVDSDSLLSHLRASETISNRGWGKSSRDNRTIADILVGQIESATHLLIIGHSRSCENITQVLVALNPGANRLALDQTSNAELREFISSSRTASQGRMDLSRPFASAQVVPPWLDLLQANSHTTGTSGQFLYRRSLPFDPVRFEEWLSNPPSQILRGKGRIWFAHRCAESFGYSCAGSVHRVFSAGPWWANYRGTAWPSCEVARDRLLAQWHPHFGDRRQEIAFIGSDLDGDQIGSELDACLLSEEEAISLISSPEPFSQTETDVAHRAGLQ